MFKKSENHKILIVYDKNGIVSKTAYKKWIFVPPWKKYKFLDVQVMQIKYDKEKFATKCGHNIFLSVRFVLITSVKDETLSIVAKNFFDNSEKKNSEFARAILDKCLEEYIGQYEIAEFYNGMRKNLIEMFFDFLSNCLIKEGLKLANINLIDMDDDNGVIDGICRTHAKLAVEDAKRKLNEQ